MVSINYEREQNYFKLIGIPGGIGRPGRGIGPFGRPSIPRPTKDLPPPTGGKVPIPPVKSPKPTRRPQKKHPNESEDSKKQNEQSIDD
jgi:hypothetical protein